MIPSQFDYVAPANLEVAVNLLKDHTEAWILAGSHSLIAAMKQGGISPALLVDLRKISHLEGIQFQPNNDLRINGMTTYAQVAKSLEIKANYPALIEAAQSIGDAQIRNHQAIGDVFAYGDLARDFTAVSLVLQATFNTLGVTENRNISAEELISKSYQNHWHSREIVTSIDFPAYISGSSSAYQAFRHPASGYTLCGIAAFVQIKDGVVSQCRMAVTGATAQTTALTKVQAAIIGKAPTLENIELAAKLAPTSVDVISADGYASAEYRAQMMVVMSKRTLTRAIEKAGMVN